MFNSKLSEEDQDRLDQMETDIRSLVASGLRRDRRIDLALNRINQLQSALMQINFVVNENAKVGNKLGETLDSLEKQVEEDADFNEERFDGVVAAVNLLAASLGKELAVKPAVPTTITVTPGEPEKLVLLKAKRQKSLPRPKPVTVEVPDGLVHLPGGFNGSF